MIEDIKKQVYELLKQEDSGHGMDHINRVLRLALKFADKEHANKDTVSLIALLHDVDDYKLFGDDNAENLTNAKRIMDLCNIPKNIQDVVSNAINNMGYKKRLNGISPNTLEGKIVSDADMCDGLGATTILRSHSYHLKHNSPFFDKDVNSDNYKICSSSAVCHMFEKILKLKNYMLTDSGKEEASRRHQIVVDFLYHLFEEEDAPEWTKYLDEFLKQN